MGNILQEILENRKKSLEDDFKKIENLFNSNKVDRRQPISKFIGIKGDISIISEIKPASPTLGNIKTEINVENIAKEMESAGAIGLSVLTEPNYFHGSFDNLKLAVNYTKIPCLMKDFVFDERQFQIANQVGASNILLINCLGNMETLCEYTNQYQLEPLIEIHDAQELNDLEHLNQIGFNLRLVGVNNRDLKTLKTDLDTSKEIIPHIKEKIGDNIYIISESGIETKKDIEYLLTYKADAFLIGSSIMKNKNIKQKIMELRGIAC